MGERREKIVRYIGWKWERIVNAFDWVPQEDIEWRLDDLHVWDPDGYCANLIKEELYGGE